MEKVFAFEPAIKNYETLNRHIIMNKIKNISTYNYLVGDSVSNVMFYEDVKRVNPMNSLILYKRPKLYRKSLRKQITLDSFCKLQNVVPDVIKIDVEGAELFVLKGAQKILKEHQPTIFLSLHPKHMKSLGLSVYDLINFIDDLCYEIRDIDLNIPNNLILGEYFLIPKNLNKL